MNAPNAEETHPHQSPAQVIENVKTAAVDHCNSACGKAKDFVTKNPVPTIFGALVFGAAVGYLVYSRRESVPERLIRESASLRHRLHAAPSRLSSLFHDGIDAASSRAEKASHYLHDLPTDDILHSLSKSFNRVSNRIKFW